ncbi:hypothetical protein FH972_023270 [Carpinus fangiana]|uniref:Uncharacterized protein n=1 Tax=Carpinus fangiana TaxID=176857 RepID=A0A5N6KWZ1_9ROSI|nr:hypothetical protein FH972_023270 [Carpinus fangiana]
MRLSSQIHWLVALRLLATKADAWILDASCKKYQTLVQDGVSNAFDLASAGQDGLNSLDSGTASQEMQNLRDYIFYETSGTDQAARAKFSVAQNVFRDVLSFDKANGAPSPKGQPGQLPVDDVIVYCDYSRFTEGKSCGDGSDTPGYACDTDTNLDVLMDDGYTKCKSSLSRDTTMAWTLNNNDEPAIAQVQICGWFLGQENNRKHKIWGRLENQWIWHPNLMPPCSMNSHMQSKPALPTTLAEQVKHMEQVNMAVPPKTLIVMRCLDLVCTLKPVGKDFLINHALPGSFMINPGSSGITAQTPNQDGSISVIPSSNNNKKRNPPALAARAVTTATANVTLTIADDTVTVDAAALTTGFVVTPKPITVLPGSQYHIGSDNASISVDAIIVDTVTYFFASTNSTQGPTTFTQSTSSGPSNSSSSQSSSSSRFQSSTSNSSVISSTSSSSSSSGNQSQNSTSSSSSTSTTGSGTLISSLTSSSIPYDSTTITSGSTTSIAPITVISVTKSGSTTPVTYIGTQTSSQGGKPTPAWMCTGPLCDTGSGCLVPIFCPNHDGSGSSWGLCCNWNPIPPPGGSISPNGPEPAPPGPSDPTPSGTQTGTQSSTNTDSSSSCSETKTASSCAITVSVFTPTSQTTVSTSTITGTCSTTTGCSVTDTKVTTTKTSDKDSATVTPIFHIYDWDGDSNWLDEQESLIEAAASATDPLATWAASSTSNSIPSTLATSPSLTAPSLVPTTSITRSLSSSSSSLLSGLNTTLGNSSTGSLSSSPTTPSATSTPSSGLYCAPTNLAPPGVPQDHVQVNVTEWCGMLGKEGEGVSVDNQHHNGIFLTSQGGLPLVNEALQYYFPNVTMYLNITLTTGSFVITEQNCKDSMLQVLNGCPPFEKAPLAAHLFKFGGGIPVTTSDGSANFNISLVPNPNDDGNEPNCQLPDC